MVIKSTAYGFLFPVQKKTVILLHGLTYTLFGSENILNFSETEDLMYSMPDSRFHGKSGGGEKYYIRFL
jgi:hypothetical protein